MRVLAHGVRRLGHSADLLAIRDRYVQTPEVQSEDGGTVVRVQKPADIGKPDVVHARFWQADVASLQYVPYAYDSRGLPIGLGRFLRRRLPTAAWHVMFHELWLGLEQGSQPKHRLVGAVQKHIALRLLKTLRPIHTHTQCSPYLEVLRHQQIATSKLPLFGNIPIREGNGWGVLKQQDDDRVLGESAREDWLLVGVFGSVHPQWLDAFDPSVILEIARSRRKRPALVLIGRHHLSTANLVRLRTLMAATGPLVAVGELSEPDLSPVLQEMDLGLATTPAALIEKSGSVAAMREHGLPIIVHRTDWSLRSLPSSSPQLAGIFPMPPRENGWTYEQLGKLPPATRLSEVAGQFVSDLERGLAHRAGSSPS